MADARIFGFLSILIGAAIVILSSFLSILPLFFIVGMMTGAGIFISGTIILSNSLTGKICPTCGEVLMEGSRVCSVCGQQAPTAAPSSLIRRLLH